MIQQNYQMKKTSVMTFEIRKSDLYQETYIQIINC